MAGRLVEMILRKNLTIPDPINSYFLLMEFIIISMVCSLICYFIIPTLFIIAFAPNSIITKLNKLRRRYPLLSATIKKFPLSLLPKTQQEMEILRTKAKNSLIILIFVCSLIAYFSLIVAITFNDLNEVQTVYPFIGKDLHDFLLIINIIIWQGPL